MSIFQQAKTMNDVHGCEASVHVSGLGLGECSLQRWQGYLHEYTVPNLVYPMIAWQTSGRVKLRTVEKNKTFSEDYVMPGDMAIIPRNQEVHWSVHGEVSVGAIIFGNRETADHLQSLYHTGHNQLSQNNHIGAFSNTFIYTTCNHLLNALLDEDNQAPQEYLDTFFKSLELYILRYLGKLNDGLRLASRNYSNDICYTLKHLTQNLKSRVLIEDIAEQLATNVSYLNRKFKSEVGISPHQYLLQQRIKRARKMLAQTTIDIASIAVETGFSDQSHLTRCFSKEVGLPPLKYRTHTQKKIYL